MGCGKSKHDVASGNTILQRKKSSVKQNKGQESKTQTKDDNNNDVNVNVSSEVEVQKQGDNVQEVVGGKAGDDSKGVKSKNENANLQEETVLEKSKEIDADDEVKSSKNENADVREEKVLEKSEEVVAGGDEVKSSKTENANVQEEENKSKEVAGEEKLGLEGASEKSQGGEDDSLKLENDLKVNDADAAAAEENKPEDVSVKEKILVKEEATEDIKVSTSEGAEKDLTPEEEQKENSMSNQYEKAN